jgi:hypothetical protein
MRQDLVPVVDATADPSLQAGVSRERVIRAIQNRDVEGARVAGRWLVSPESLREWVASLVPPVTDPGTSHP